MGTNALYRYHVYAYTFLLSRTVSLPHLVGLACLLRVICPSFFARQAIFICLQGESKTKLAAGVKPLAGGGGIFKSAAVEVLRRERRLMTTGDITKYANSLSYILAAYAEPACQGCDGWRYDACQ